MIQEYFTDNGVFDPTPEEIREFKSRRERYEKAKMVLAQVNEQEQARHFFNQYDIPFQITKTGENKGLLRVMPVRSKDRDVLMEAKKVLTRYGFSWAIDHSNYFRDDRDRTVVTFSPYGGDVIQLGGVFLDNFEVTYSDWSIYGYMTPTIVMREMY